MTTTPSIPWRVQGAVYGAGLFSNSAFHFYNLIVPLWIVTLQPTPFVIGLVIGGRHFLALLLTIHGGALMDRLGTRRVMLATATIAAASPLFYPLMPWIPGLIVLQMISGLAVMLTWVGAQTLIGQIMRGSTTHAGRLSFFTRLGVFAGPPLIGAAWDAGGPWGAFGAMALWSSGALISVLALPVPPTAETAPASQEARPRLSLRALMPDIRDYPAAFSLLGIPAIAMVIMVTMLRHSGVAVQSSFYVVYLGQLGITGTAIGLLLSMNGICGAAGSLLTGSLARKFQPVWLMLGGVVASVVAVTVTPLLGVYMAFMIAIGVRGATNGVAQSVEMALMAQSADARDQGKAAALRVTAGRIAAVVLPVIMGAVVEVAGIENSFFIMGGGVMALAVLIAIHIKRSGAFAAVGRQ